MTIPVDDTTIVRCVALTAAPLFVDVTGMVTGTIGGTYNPVFVGERGFMAHVDAEPLDLNVPTTGDQLCICFKHTPYDISQAAANATPIAAAEAEVQERQQAVRKAMAAAPGNIVKAPEAPETETEEN